MSCLRVCFLSVLAVLLVHRCRIFQLRRAEEASTAAARARADAVTRGDR